MEPYSLNINGRIVDFAVPHVMGILNLTPDSFYAASRQQTDDEILRRTEQICVEGGTMIDVGAYSSRPGADEVPEEEEMRRLRHGLKLVRQVAPDAVLSVDTFRADVARMCVEDFGVGIINDISGGSLDGRMFQTVARLGVPYVLMHMRGTPRTMQQQTSYDNLMVDMMVYFSQRVRQLRELGQKDIIIDPGFGFAKTLDQNYELLAHVDLLRQLGLPILIGVSRKRMVYQLLGTTPEESLNGTTVLHTLCLSKGCADIIRVHDVGACVEAVKICRKMSLES